MDLPGNSRLSLTRVSLPGLLLMMMATITIMSTICDSARKVTNNSASVSATPKNKVLRESYIHFGDVAKRGQFPSTVLISMLDGVFCTAVIIGQRHVITAAHCVIKCCFNGDGTSKRGIHFGDVYTNILTLNDMKSGHYNQKLRIKKIYVHKDTLREWFKLKANSVGDRDVAILTLEKSIKIGKGVALSTMRQVDRSELENDEVTVVGYGYDENNHYGTLKVGRVTLLEDCDLLSKQEITFCYDFGENEQRQAVGDSGGPVFDMENNVVAICSGMLGNDFRKIGVMVSLFGVNKILKESSYSRLFASSAQINMTNFRLFRTVAFIAFLARLIYH